ncbi:hypothetical protein BOA8489_03948 [Boseongicola aestuarii]|uniref:Uncharacterized protein n=1 Tax=Boseongicola aestuarii TaxID=1470561 RepID=A0A238J611_9RHOB|nr:hypothetical protein BOA8489_03948 [Boseongicola aestuarii]
MVAPQMIEMGSKQSFSALLLNDCFAGRSCRREQSLEGPLLVSPYQRRFRANVIKAATTIFSTT